MAKRRFVAPARGAVAPACFVHPMFDRFAPWQDWLRADAWPTFEALNAALADTGASERFVLQDAALLSDGFHYETRIADTGRIATRAGNWHDLLNALVWIAYPAVKRALNRRQVAEIGIVGPAQRTRPQCALTHFDEGGAIVIVRDPAPLALWDAHDWHGLFWRERDAWRAGRIEAIVFGHALMEHALTPDQLITAKCIAVAGGSVETAVSSVARAIAAGESLNDPQDLRPLPLSGIAGWHPSAHDENFFAQADCFRPLRPGRIYPAPLIAS